MSEHNGYLFWVKGMSQLHRWHNWDIYMFYQILGCQNLVFQGGDVDTAKYKLGDQLNCIRLGNLLDDIR